jgi:hypothetical protein
MNDEELTAAWEAASLGRAVTHHEHVRIAWLLISTFGRSEGTRRVKDGTLRNCVTMASPQRFDPSLTDRWSSAIADVVETSTADTSSEFLDEHPELLESDRFGLPAWKERS